MQPLGPQEYSYLKSRGYTDQLIEAEHILAVPAGLNFFEGGEFFQDKPGIGFQCFSPSGEFTGVTTRAILEKEYRFRATPGKSHLLVAYAAEEDYELAYNYKTVVLVEGVFDRVAIKRMAPGIAVIARMSKGISKALEAYLRRYTIEVWLAFDQDEGGKKATEFAKKKLKDLRVNEVELPAKDPAKLLENYGLSRASELWRERTAAFV